MGKKVLIVYAHQSCSSFNAGAKDAAVEVLKAQGCEVTVSDLYAMKFKATATAEDITGGIKNAEHFRYAQEMKSAWDDGRLSCDIKGEHDKVTEADLIIFQFPMYWFSVPAIMKGWIDRVLTPGFAYSQEKCYDQGNLKNKKALLSFTTGSQETMFSANGIHGDIHVSLWPLQYGILHYCGFQVLAPQIFFAPSSQTPKARKSMLGEWRGRLENLMGEEPLSFPSRHDFDEKCFQLKPDVAEKFASQEFGPALGVHLGKRLPPTCQKKAGV